MQPLQIIVIIFSLFALSRLILRKNERSVPLGEFIFWFIIWTGAVLIALFPSYINAAAENAGVSNTIDLILMVTTLTLFYLQFRLYVKVEQQGQETTRLVREIALQKKKEK